MRIAIIANSVDALWLDRAGGFVHLVETAKRWNGAELTVLGPVSAEATFRRHLPNIAYLGVPDAGGQMTARSMLFRAFAALRHVPALRKRCDVALAMSHSIPDALPAIAFGASRSAVQYWHFIGNPFERPGPLLRNLLAYANELVGRSIAERCRGFIFGNTVIGKSMKRLGSPYTCVTTNGVSRPADTQVTSTRSGSVYIGRLHPAKGVEDLIAVWSLVHSALPSERLRLIGSADASYRSHLQSEIAKRGLRGVVEICEGVDDVDKWALLGSSKLFAFASREEGWGIAIAEAMTAGLPCVTYELPPFKDIFTEGRVSVAIGDVDRFASVVIELLTNDARYVSLSAQAQHLAQTFSWENAARAEWSVLRELVER